MRASVEDVRALDCQTFTRSNLSFHKELFFTRLRYNTKNINPEFKISIFALKVLLFL